jgi:hypothetical protein
LDFYIGLEGGGNVLRLSGPSWTERSRYAECIITFGLRDVAKPIVHHFHCKVQYLTTHSMKTRLDHGSPSIYL